MVPVPPPEEFTGPRSRPAADPWRDGQGATAPAGDRGEETIRRLKDQGAREPAPSALRRIVASAIAVMRGRNWLTGLVIPMIVAIAAGIAAVVIAGANGGNGGPVPSALSAGFPPARNAAADFTGTPALAGRGVDQQLAQVAVSGTTAVAVGSQSGTRIPRPRFFYSADNGKNWHLAAVRGTSAPGSAPTLVAGGTRGWLALGPRSVFISPNARSWRPGTALPEIRGDAVTVLIATASGFLAAGSNTPGGGAAQASPVLWMSANGTTWQRISGTRLGLTSDAGRVLGIRSAAANGDRVLIAAAIEGGGSATWLSADGGQAWTPVTVPVGARDSAAIAGLAPLGKGFVAVRAAPGNGSAGVFISANGTTWQRSATLTAANGAPLTLGLVSGGPAGAVITGKADGLHVAFLSANGVTWRGPNPVDSTAAELVSGAALTSGGQAVIAGTSAGSAVQRQPMLTVIGTQGSPDQIDTRAIAGVTIPEIGVNAIAASGATEVAAGSADGYPALWTSADGGTAWTRAAGATPAALNRAGDGQLTGVAHGADGWVSVGGAYAGATPGIGGSGLGGASSGGGVSHPVVVTSAAGRTWTSADGEKAFAGSGVVTFAVAAARAGYVIVGRQAVGGKRTIAAAWYAEGLAGWRRAADARTAALAGTGNRQMDAVTATGKGFAAVGSGDGHPAVWLSVTGRTWSETTLPLPQGAGSAALSHVAANGNTVAATGMAATAAGAALPFAAVSANGGTTWAETLLPAPTGSAAPAVTALTAAGGGFTATGSYGTRGARDVVIWMLDHGAAPGATWTMAAPNDTGLAGPGTHEVTALASAGTTVTGVGFSATAATENPVLWQSPVRS